MMKLSNFYAYMVLLILMGSCASGANVVATQSAVPPSLTSDITNTPALILPSTTPSPVSTPTQIPPTQTPLPTLAPDEVKIKLFDLLLNNGGCALPCFLGYSPGISTKDDIQNFFGQFGVQDAPDLSISRTAVTARSIIGFYIRLNNHYLNMGISTYESMGEVKVIEMGSFIQPDNSNPSQRLDNSYTWDLRYAEVMHYYLLQQILAIYGEPSEVIILTYRNDRQRPDVTSFPFFLVLLYPEQGFYVKYKMERITSGINFLGCPSKSFVDVVVWPPNNDKIFEGIVKPTINSEYLSDYKSLSDATSMTINEFHQIFSNPDTTNCIVTPIETWPNP